MLGPIVFVVTFAVYAWTAAPAITWLDAPEFAAAAQSLGVPHSPGQPLAPFLGHLAALVPIGSIPFRVAILSGAAQAAAVAILASTIFQLSDVISPNQDARARKVVSGAFALLFAFSWAIWFQGVRCEVYALVNVLLLGVVALVLKHERNRDQRLLVAAALLTGLALATHHFMTVLVAVPVLVFIWARKRDLRPRLTVVTASVASGFLGMCLWLYLPIRAATHPLVNWGNPTTLDRFWWTISAKAFQKTAGAEQVSSGTDDFVQATIAGVDSLGIMAALLCLPGFYFLWRRDRRVALLLLACAVAALAGRALLGFDLDTPDHHAYLLMVPAAFILVAAAGAWALTDKIATQHRVVPLLPAALALALVAFQVSENYERSDLSEAYGADELVDTQLSGLPARALVLTAYFESTFRIWAARTIDGQRPDVSFLDRSFLTYPGVAESEKVRYPDLAAVIDGPLKAGSPSPLGTLDKILHRRPILVELHPNVDADLRERLMPIGAFAMYTRRQPGAADVATANAVAAHHRDFLTGLLSEAPVAVQHATLSMLVWYDFVHLTHFCERGQQREAQLALDHARSLLPDDLSLNEIAGNCALH